MSRRHPQLAPIALVACLLLTCLACFEDPVEEVVVIELHPENHATITARIELLPISPEENIAAWRRVDHYRSTLLEGSDPWTRRFEGLQPLSEAYHWEKSNGVLRAVERTALIDARQLSLFFADSGVSVFVTGTDDWRELSIYPGESTRATPEQKSLLASRTDLWTSALASYFRALESVYAYMKERPDREGALFTHVFQEFVSDDELEAAADLSETEMALVDDLRAAMEEAWSVLELPPEEAHSLNEISYLVHDPFPSDVEIILPIEPSQVEGFEQGDGRYLIRRTGLKEAFGTLESTWATPDVLTIWIDAALGSTNVEIESVMSSPRSIDVPSAGEIETALEEMLKPLPVYRLRWREPSTR